jgi:type IV pilus assembly protein PilB
MTEDIRDLAIRRESAEVIGARARAHGMRVLREDGLLKVRAGLTSIAEVTRVVGA